MKSYIGLDIGGTKILGALFDQGGKILKKVKKKTRAEQGGDYVIKRIQKVIDDLLEGEDVNLLGIGAGYPGVVEDSSRIRFTPNIPLNDFNLREIIQDKYKVPFILANDVNAAIYGEWKSGEYSDFKNVLGLYVGTGIGGAIIADGNLYLGKGAAGEIGHMIVNAGGAYCGCGSRGCLEAYASKTAIQNRIIAAVYRGETTLLEDSFENTGMLKSSAIKAAYKSKDPLMLEILDEVVYYLGIGCANLINIFHPDMIILGGGIIESLADELIPSIQRIAVSNAIGGMGEKVKFERSYLGDDAGIVGAYNLICEYLKF